MKLQFDFDNKTIKVEGNVNAGKLVKTLNMHLPGWEDWDLQTNTVINNWNSPIVIDWDLNNPFWKIDPYNQVYVSSQSPLSSMTTNNATDGILTVSANSQEVVTGVFNVEMN